MVLYMLVLLPRIITSLWNCICQNGGCIRYCYCLSHTSYSPAATAIVPHCRSHSIGSHGALIILTPGYGVDSPLLDASLPDSQSRSHSRCVMWYARNAFWCHTCSFLWISQVTLYGISLIYRLISSNDILYSVGCASYRTIDTMETMELVL